MSTNDDFIDMFLNEALEIIKMIDKIALERLIKELVSVREHGGRLFILGVGGSAGHSSHAVNDFRKLCRLEAYSPTDNVSELTARTNDEGWGTTFSAWLEISRASERDAIMVFSVGGGDEQRNISTNIVRAVDYASEKGCKILGIVGRDGGYVAKKSDACVIIPPLFPDRITPHTEGLCAVIWHLIVSHPQMSQVGTKWETSK